IQDFPFVEPPDYRMVKDGLQTLHELGAIDENNELTEIGRQMSKLPIDPRLARMIIEAGREQCLDEVLVIVSALSIQDPRERPMEKQQAADAKHAKFQDERSDFLALLKIWKFYREQQKQLSHNRMRRLCKENFLSFIRMREWDDVHQQLRALAFEVLPPRQRPSVYRHPRQQRR
ncbi:MAG: ATP-dependent RNA helicase HrpA, partial [Tepidisphaeraceae bacterium]